MRKFPAILTAFIIAGCAGNATPNATMAGFPQSGAMHATAGGPPVINGCQIFPAATTPATGENWWNADVSKLPLDPNSNNYIAALPGNLHPDFGQNPAYGIPFVVVPATQKKVPVSFQYKSEQETRAVSDSPERADRGRQERIRRLSRSRPPTGFAVQTLRAVRGEAPKRR